MTTLSHYLLTQAYNNAWSNHRLLRACAQLSLEEFNAIRVSFFPSITATLNHNLTVDWMYIDAMERDLRGAPPHADIDEFFEPEHRFADCAALWQAQRQADQRLIDYCRQLDGQDLAHKVAIARGGGVTHDGRSRLLAHLFQHQIHHRGQVHAMLAGTSVEPPQLDEFFSEGEVEMRAQDFAELGWTEVAVWCGRSAHQAVGRSMN